MLDPQAQPLPAGARVDAIGVGVAARRARILQDVSLSVCPGEFVGVLGPSGCGKSTLLKVLSGQLRPGSGHALVDGRSPEADANRARIGFVPQDDIVHGALRVDHALAFSARLRLPPGTPRDVIRARVDALLDLLELQDRRRNRIERLSGGQRKRVSIGVELLTEPPLLFLDEPTAGLDPLLEERMMDFFRGLANQGRTVMVSTHILQSLRLLDLVCVLAAGRVAFFGTPDEALIHFGVPHPHDLYRALAADAAVLDESWRGSPLHERYVGSRLADRQSP